MYNSRSRNDDYYHRRSIPRPLGAPQPSSNAPGAYKDEPGQDEHTVGTVSCTQSGTTTSARSLLGTSQINRGAQSGSDYSRSRNTRSDKSRSAIGNDAKRRDSHPTKPGMINKTRRSGGARSSNKNIPSSESNTKTTTSARRDDGKMIRNKHSSSSSRRPSSKRNRGSGGFTRMDGHVPSVNRTRMKMPRAVHMEDSESDVGSLPLRLSYHNRRCLSWLFDDLDWEWDRDRSRNRNRDHIMVHDLGASDLPNAPVSSAGPNAAVGRNLSSNSSYHITPLSPQVSLSLSSITHSFSDNASTADRSVAAGMCRNDEDRTNTKCFDPAPRRDADAVVAEIVDEAQLEAEFAERVRSRMALATEIRQSATAEDTAKKKRGSRGDGNSKRSRNARKKREVIKEPRDEEETRPKRRMKLCLAGWFLLFVVVLTVVLKLFLPTRVNEDGSWATKPDESNNWWKTPYQFTGGDSDRTSEENSKNQMSANSSSTQFPLSIENLEKENYLRQMAMQISGLSFVEVKNNPQRLALEWMLTDPYIFWGVIDNESNPGVKLAERYALAVVYFSTSGETWFDDIGFLSASSVCDWNACNGCIDQVLHHSHYGEKDSREDLPYIYKEGERRGVICNANNEVIGLRLDHNNMIGTIPSELQILRQMKDLSMSSNEGLSGTIPPELGELVYTSALKFSRCNLQGTLPDTMQLLTELELFSVYQNQLTGTLPERLLEAIPGLRTGDFGSNQFEGTIPDVFGAQSSLQNLFVDGNNLRGPIPSSLYSSTSLQILDFSDNNLEGRIAPQVSAMKDLRRLVLDKNQFSGTLPTEFAKVIYLEHFSASHNALSGSLPHEVVAMRKLVHLDLSFNNFTNKEYGPETIGGSPSLGFLNLESNPYFGGVSAMSASDLKRSSLAEVNLKDTNIQGLNDQLCENSSFPENSFGMGIRIHADCLENGFVQCDCCASCCESDGVNCVANTDGICRAHKDGFQKMWDDIIQNGSEHFSMDCKCKDDNQNLSGLYHTFCNDGYKVIDTDGTEYIDTKHYICLRDNYDYNALNAPDEPLICAANTNYGYTFDESTGAEISFQNTIVYGEESTRWSGTSILFRSYSEGEGPYCQVWVDGEQCEECIPADCGGGDDGRDQDGFVISCRNLNNQHGSYHQGYTFDSCTDNARSSRERRDKNGYLEIFHAAVDRSIVECYDGQSCTTGQLPIFLKFLQTAPEWYRA